MKRFDPRTQVTALVSLLGAAGFAAAQPAAPAKDHPTPPKGWNSYTGYSIAVTQEELHKNIDFLSENLPVEGTKFRMQDIVNKKSYGGWAIAPWWNYGVDMSKPGAQKYYDGLIRKYAGLGVNFIKFGDMVPSPEEVKAAARAIGKCGCPMVLSLSPGVQPDSGTDCVRGVRAAIEACRDVKASGNQPDHQRNRWPVACLAMRKSWFSFLP